MTISRRGMLGASAAGLAATVALSADPAAARTWRKPLRPGPDEPTVSALTPFVDPLPIPPRVTPVTRGGVSHLTIPLVNTAARLHSQLPPTRLWSFGGVVPGPTIEVRRGQRLRITWTNQLTGTVPVTAVEAANINSPWNAPGRSGATPRPDVAALGPWTAAHLHGMLTGANNDGWPENVLAPGESQLSEYPNDQAAALLLYHDHAMSVTRWNVFAGLAGSYVIRDDEEDRLGLPSGNCEIPLFICDRNFDTTPDGLLTGDLLHKVTVVNDQGWMRAHTGPFTMVNGVIWPYRDVPARWCRLRVTNAANTRQYHLRLVDEHGATVPFQLIGADAGLLDAPQALTDGITLASAERADLLVDFGAYAGQRLRLVNAEVNPDPGPWPQVMEFRVGQPVTDPFRLPPTLSRSYTPVTTVPADAPDRLVVLTPMGPTQALLWEMAKIPAPPGPLPRDGIIQLTEADGSTSTYQRTSVAFGDPATFTVTGGSWERWRFLHAAASGWPHPMHLHAAGFQVLRREQLNLGGFGAVGGYGFGTTTPIKVTGAGPALPGDTGWKDTVRVQAAELVTVAAKFGPASGKFVYHCHMLEHEDMGMMRHFRVMPAALQAIEMRDDMGMTRG
jgi:o-aminophenol oxidase